MHLKGYRPGSSVVGLTWVDSMGSVNHRGPEDRQQKAEDRGWKTEEMLPTG